MWLRTSISGLMVGIVVIAVGFAALMNPTIWWASGLCTLEVVSFSLACLLALAGPERVRKTCLGFAIFGLAYFVASRYYTNYNSVYISVPLLIELIILHYYLPNADLEANWFMAHTVYSIGTLVFACIGGALGHCLDIRARPPNAQNREIPR